MSILDHLTERLRQKSLRSQITRSKTLTPILDSVNAAARLEGVSPDEIVADYLSGKNEHPVITAALGRPILPPRPAVKPPAKPSPKPAVAFVRPPVKATVPASKFSGADEHVLIQCATHRSANPADRAEAVAELNKRGINITADNFIQRSSVGGRSARLK